MIKVPEEESESERDREGGRRGSDIKTDSESRRARENSQNIVKNAYGNASRTRRSYNELTSISWLLSRTSKIPGNFIEKRFYVGRCCASQSQLIFITLHSN